MPVRGTVMLSVGLLLLGGVSFGTSNKGTDCGHPAVPANARVSLSSEKSTPGTVATYRCDEGYETFGNTEITCSSSGQWKGELPFCATNVAVGRPANQSTTVRSGGAGLANDGQRDRCAETLREASPWWRVDLLRPHLVRAVRITTRGCCGHQPLRDIEIRVGNSSQELQRNPLCTWFPGTLDEGVTKAFTCARAVTGQHVFIQLVGVEGSLSLCEVEVFTTDGFSVESCATPTTPAEVELGAFAGTCYEFWVQRGGSWEEAREQCRSRGNGDLVHSSDRAATDYLHQELERRRDRLRTQLVWIGAQRMSSGSWNWVSGEPVDHPAWGKDQPNNYNGEQNCVVLDGGRGWLWNDVGCNLDYLHWICQHDPLWCGSPDQEANTTIIGGGDNDSRRTGSTIQYQCPEGHVLVGDQKRTCLEEGRWSGQAPTCKWIDCGSLSDLEHGTVTLPDSRTTYNARSVYSCHENHTLVGQEERRCDETGYWSGEAPTCLLDRCPEPPKVERATVKPTGKRAGDTAVYTCDSDDLVLLGASQLTCGLGGEWQGKPPSCERVDCGPPPGVKDGSHSSNGTTVGAAVEYHCDGDHWLVGEAVLRCDLVDGGALPLRGRWVPDPPMCELITCEEPDVPSGSFVVGYDFNVHSTIEYHCEAGHVLRGEPMHTCSREGQWSGETPVCEYVECGKIQALVNGDVRYLNDSTYLGSEIQYSCTKNYRLVDGDSRRICKEEGQWSGATPRCEEIRCPEPVIAEHGIVSVTGNDRVYGRTLIRTSESGANTGATSYRIGALAKYSCERGHRLLGQALSTCEDSGIWSGQTPSCVYMDCGDPGDIENGVMNLASNATYYGALALYSCHPDYELDGVSRRLCLENGTWSSESPACREIRCDELESTDNVEVVTVGRQIGGIAVYSCNRGHSMEGNSSRTCTKRGWTDRPPRCIPIDCGHPGEVDNGRVIAMNGTSFGNAIEYHCVPGFERTGAYLRRCLDSGKWSGEQPRCLLSSVEPQPSSNLGTHIGIGAGVVVFLLILLGLVYLKLRRAVPVKATDNVQTAERKDERSAAVMSYATLNAGGLYGQRPTSYQLPANIYENITDGDMYDCPYEETSSGTYEPEPQPIERGQITINGVAVR